jgi:hypothetical protein
MRRITLALLWFGCAPAAFGTPAAAFYTIDPITRDPIYYGQVQRPQVNRPRARELPLDREL